ncbi:MAG: hypothetical protein M1824_000602 [Vezdaea acicularis]|nr:MAG: hypothetical protein M1824_000602 [Vezdaea acicularis]
MTSSPTILSVSDLRSPSREHKRAKDHSAKWALGEAEYPVGRRGGQMHENQHRPVIPQRKVARAIKLSDPTHARTTHRTSRSRQLSISSALALPLSPLPYSPTAPSGTTILSTTSNQTPTAHFTHHTTLNQAPLLTPETEQAYSFDASLTPQAHAESVLGLAVQRAVERYEGRVTEKLVREEWEVVREREDDLGSVCGSAVGRGEDEGFELL